MTRKFFIGFIVSATFACPLFAQTDSLGVAQTAEQIIIVTLDQESEGRLASIDDSAKHYTLQELLRAPKGLDSENLAFWISILALFISLVAFMAEFVTARNTANAPYEGQIQQFEDLIRHFYRNLVCSKAMRDRFFSSDNTNPKRYPSEIHYLKLKSLPEDAILPINNKLYPRLHELKLLIRNYNEDIDVALRHIVRTDLGKDVIDGDFDNLLFKPYSLTAKIVNTEDAIARSRRLYFWKPRGIKLLDNSINIILLEHFIKLVDNEKYIEKVQALDSSSAYVQAQSSVLLGGARAFEQLMNMFKNESTFKYYDTKAEAEVEKHTRLYSREKFIRYMQGIKPGSDAISKAIAYLQAVKTTQQEDSAPSTLLEQYKRLLGSETWDIAQILYFALHIDSIIESQKVIKLIDYEK